MRNPKQSRLYNSQWWVGFAEKVGFEPGEGVKIMEDKSGYEEEVEWA